MFCHCKILYFQPITSCSPEFLTNKTPTPTFYIKNSCKFIPAWCTRRSWCSVKFILNPELFQLKLTSSCYLMTFWIIVELGWVCIHSTKFKYLKYFNVRDRIKGIVSRDEKKLFKPYKKNRYCTFCKCADSFKIFFFLVDDKIKLKVLACSLKLLTNFENSPVTASKTLRQWFLHWKCLQEAACGSAK